jgi:hypothetical protein
MNILFPDLVIPDIPAFREPTRSEIAAWLRVTAGVWTLDILRWLGRHLPPEGSQAYRDRDITYTALTMSQQWWIICELQDKN